MKFKHIHHVSQEFLDTFRRSYSPVFVLNTGRSGSAFIQKIYSKASNFNSYHEASPNLFLLPNFAFHNQDKGEMLRQIFAAARTELILSSAVQGKEYIESNQCLVFFIRQIVDLFPQARFIHLTRSPSDFVISAIKKGWHKNDSVWELGRIKSTDSKYWNSLTQIQKLGWVWNETHVFIETFKTDHPNNCITVRLEDVVNDQKEFDRLLSFTGVDKKESGLKFKNVVAKKVNEVSISPDEPPNMYKLEDFPNYSEWAEEDKNDLKSMTGILASQYNYNL